MGFNSVAIILNDHVHEMKDSADIGQQIYDAVCNWGMQDRYPFCTETQRGGLRIVSQTHADYQQVVIVSGNCARALSMGDKPLPGDLEALAFILKDHGWKVSKPRAVLSKVREASK